MDDAAIHRREAETGLLLLKDMPQNSGVTYPLYLKPCTGLGLPSGTENRKTISAFLDYLHNLGRPKHTFFVFIKCLSVCDQIL